MSELQKKTINAKRRSARTRATMHGTEDRPRFTVTVSNMHVHAQIINDDSSKTLVAATTVGTKISGNLTEKSVAIGKKIAEEAKKKKITKVVFDRGDKQYHGRIKALADSARENGLEF